MFSEPAGARAIGPDCYRGSDGKSYRVGDEIPRGVRLAAPGEGRGGYPAGSRSEAAFVRANAAAQPSAARGLPQQPRLNVDRTAEGEDGAAWARRLQGVPLAALKRDDDDRKAAAAKLSKDVIEMASGSNTNAEGESGAEWARRVLGKKGNGR